MFALICLFVGIVVGVFAGAEFADGRVRSGVFCLFVSFALVLTYMLQIKS